MIPGNNPYDQQLGYTDDPVEKAMQNPKSGRSRGFMKGFKSDLGVRNDLDNPRPPQVNYDTQRYRAVDPAYGEPVGVMVNANQELPVASNYRPSFSTDPNQPGGVSAGVMGGAQGIQNDVAGQQSTPQQASQFTPSKDDQVIQDVTGKASSIPGVGGIVAAAIGAQHQMTNMNDRETDGQRTGDVFSGDMTTEPWLGFLSNKLGTRVTPGEKFDAARKNHDKKGMKRVAPSMLYQWADPVSELAGGYAEKKWGDKGGWLVNPVSMVLRKLWK